MTSPAMPSMRQVKRVSAVPIWVDTRVSRCALSVRTSAIAVCISALNWSDVTWAPCSTTSPKRVREGVRLGGREVGSGQCPGGDGVGVGHRMLLCRRGGVVRQQRDIEGVELDVARRSWTGTPTARRSRKNYRRSRKCGSQRPPIRTIKSPS